jgi:hypothetical protein
MRWNVSNTLGGERNLKALSLSPAKGYRMVFVQFRGEGWGEGPRRVFKHGHSRIA